MKQHAPGLRRATGFLVVMLCLHVSLRVTEAKSLANDVQEGSVHKCVSKGKTRRTVHLLTAVGPHGHVVPTLHEGNVYIWRLYSSRTTTFKLEENGTSLVVPKKGLYLLNLKMYYNMHTGHKCTGKLFLMTNIMKYHDSYPEWINVTTSRDSMQCVDHWSQSVTVSQVVRLEKGTKLRVTIDPENYDYITGDDSTYFSVTLL